MSAHANPRVPQLDGLRGLAIGLVLFFHYGSTSRLLWPLASQGWIGVDLFFVLSGFLIGGIVLDNRQAANFYFVFYLRRFLRIFPIYYLLLAVVAVLVWVGFSAHPDHDKLIYYAVHLQNVAMVLTHDYGLPWLRVTWSLAVEEHFYLLLPILVVVTPPRALGLVLLAGIFTAILCRIAVYAIPVDHPRDFARFLTICRMDGLFYGVLLALAIRTEHMAQAIRRHRAYVYWGAGLLATGFWAVSRYDSGDPNEILLSVIGLTLLGPLFLAVVVMAAVYEDSWVAWAMKNPALGWLGRRAYGVYLFHIPVIDLMRLAFLRAGFQHFGIALSASAVAMTFLVAALSWKYIESPLIQRSHRSKYKYGADADALVLGSAV